MSDPRPTTRLNRTRRACPAGATVPVHEGVQVLGDAYEPPLSLPPELPQRFLLLCLGVRLSPAPPPLASPASTSAPAPVARALPIALPAPPPARTAASAA